MNKPTLEQVHRLLEDKVGESIDLKASLWKSSLQKNNTSELTLGKKLEMVLNNLIKDFKKLPKYNLVQNKEKILIVPIYISGTGNNRAVALTKCESWILKISSIKDSIEAIGFSSGNVSISNKITHLYVDKRYAHLVEIVHAICYYEPHLYQVLSGMKINNQKQLSKYKESLLFFTKEELKAAQLSATKFLIQKHCPQVAVESLMPQRDAYTSSRPLLRGFSSSTGFWKLAVVDSDGELEAKVIRESLGDLWDQIPTIPQPQIEKEDFQAIEKRLEFTILRKLYFIHTPEAWAMGMLDEVQEVRDAIALLLKRKEEEVV